MMRISTNLPAYRNVARLLEHISCQRSTTDNPKAFISTINSDEISLTKDAKISFAKMQAGEYDEDAAQKKLEDPMWWNPRFEWHSQGDLEMTS